MIRSRNPHAVRAASCAMFRGTGRTAAMIEPNCSRFAACVQTGGGSGRPGVTSSAWNVLEGLVTVIFGMTPDALPDLEVISELGRGAETVVYRVRRQGEEYALKLLTRVDADNTPALAAVRREAALLGCVDHPLLPRIY